MSTLRAECGECGCPAATKWSDRDWLCPSCGSGLVLFSVTTPSTNEGEQHGHID